MSKLTDEEQSQLEFCLQNLSMFLKDFFAAGNWDFTLDIHPHNCQSGLWFTASWVDKEGKTRYVMAQWQKLLWERLIKDYLIQQRKVVSDESPSL